MNEVKLPFSSIYQIYEQIVKDDVVDMQEINNAKRYVFDFAERNTFNNLTEVYSWILLNQKTIKNLKILDCCEQMLDKDYFEQRCFKKDKWFIKRNTDAILIGAEVTQSFKLNTNDYESYKKDIMNLIFEK